MEDELQALWPPWMHQGHCFDTAPFPGPTRLVLGADDDKEILECGHLVALLFPVSNAPMGSFRRLCEDCGADAKAENVFTPSQGGGKAEVARSICFGTESGEPCPVLDTCLEFALETRQKQGIWGGKSPEERMEIQRRPKYEPEIEVVVGPSKEREVSNASDWQGGAAPGSEAGRRAS